ncbi:MAG: MarR family transcriptional regulator [Planctomycetes bacterium]|nr:MarR family transcriptional regulator [Planctomycetota bacterium]
MVATGRQGRQDASRGHTPDEDASRYDLRILNAIRQIIRAADIDSRKLASDHHITAPQLMALMAVVEKGSISATGIAKRIHLSPSTLVGILDRLESKGLIQRDRSADDRRLVWVTATDEGRALATRTPFPLQFSLDKALKQLSEKERSQTAAGMERLVNLMGAGEIEPAPMLEITAVRKRQVSGAGGPDDRRPPRRTTSG